MHHVINRKQVCVDDPRCDLDGGTPGSCTFSVQVSRQRHRRPGLYPARASPVLTLVTVGGARSHSVPRSRRSATPSLPVPAEIVGPSASDVCSDALAVPVPLRGSPGASRPALRSEGPRHRLRERDGRRHLCSLHVPARIVESADSHVDGDHGSPPIRRQGDADRAEIRPERADDAPLRRTARSRSGRVVIARLWRCDPRIMLLASLLGVPASTAVITSTRRAGTTSFPAPTTSVIATSLQGGTTWTQRIVSLLVFQTTELPTTLHSVSPGRTAASSAAGRSCAAIVESPRAPPLPEMPSAARRPAVPESTEAPSTSGATPRDVFMSMWNHVRRYYAARARDVLGRARAGGAVHRAAGRHP